MLLSQASRAAPGRWNIKQTTRKSSTFSHIKQGPPDGILGLTVAYNNDTHPKKVSLGAGAYRDDNGKPLVLQCVREAEKFIFEANVDHEYAGISGVPSFTKKAAELLFGSDSEVITQKKNVTAQTISGTGSLRVGAHFVQRFFGDRTVYMPAPTWPNHIPIFKDSGVNIGSYRYYQAESCGLDFAGMVEDLQKIPDKSAVLLHACAHNPTGVDPSIDQWKELSSVVKKKGHLPLFDVAYQGFASGDPERDAAAVRIFAAEGHDLVTFQSFAKNFGLYGERVGAFSVITQNPELAEAIDSQVKILIRPMYSNPPIYGARIVAHILADQKLSALWRVEVKQMADRIISMRHALRDGLKQRGSKRNWDHIVNQIGMFTYTGLNPKQVQELKEVNHIYMTADGRISVAGVNTKNVGYLCDSIYQVAG